MDAIASRPTTSTRRYGRDLEEAIFDAVFEELVDVGYAKLSFDGVAKRAGTGKAAVYRRWRYKSDLVGDAFVARQGSRPAFIATGDLRDDLIAYFVRIFVHEPGSPGALVMRGLVGDAHQFPEMFARLIERTWKPDMDGLKQIMRTAVARGEIDNANVTPEVLDAVPLILVARSLLNLANSRRDVVRIIDGVLLPLLHAS